mgnify:CR=1 FL=1
MQKECEVCGAIYAYVQPLEDSTVLRRGICATCFRKSAVDAALVIFRNAVEMAPDLRSKLFLYGLLMFGARKVLRVETSRKWGAMWRTLKESFTR